MSLHRSFAVTGVVLFLCSLLSFCIWAYFPHKIDSLLAEGVRLAVVYDLRFDCLLVVRHLNWIVTEIKLKNKVDWCLRHFLPILILSLIKTFSLSRFERGLCGARTRARKWQVLRFTTYCSNIMFQYTLQTTSALQMFVFNCIAKDFWQGPA